MGCSMELPGGWARYTSFSGRQSVLARLVKGKNASSLLVVQRRCRRPRRLDLNYLKSKDRVGRLQICFGLFVRIIWFIVPRYSSHWDALSPKSHVLA